MIYFTCQLMLIQNECTSFLEQMSENPSSLPVNVYNLGEMMHFKRVSFFFPEIRAIQRKARAPEPEVCVSAAAAPHRSIFIKGPSAATKVFSAGRVSVHVLAAVSVDHSGTTRQAGRCQRRPRCCF